MAQGEKLSKGKCLTEQFIPMDDQYDSHERVVFMDNDNGDPKFDLYRNTEKAEPMADLWAQSLRRCQSARDHIGFDPLGSFLFLKEMDLATKQPALDTSEANHFQFVVTGERRSK